MKKLKMISIFMVAIMLLAMIVPVTKVLAADDYSNLVFVLDGENVVEIDGKRYTKAGDTVKLVAYDKTTGEQVAIPENVGMDRTGQMETSTDEDFGKDIEIVFSEDNSEIYFGSKHTGRFYVRDLTTYDEICMVSLTAVSEEKYRELTVNEITEPTTENITAAIADYKTTIVTMNTSDTIEKEVFEKLQDCNKATLQLNAGNITWEFKSENITKIDSMFTPAYQMSTEKFEYIKPDDVKDGLFVEFAYDGKLPGKAEITIFVGTDKFGEGQKDLNLYYYNDITAKYEEMGTVAYSNGNVTLSLDHCSTYVLTEQKLGETEIPEGPEEETPETTTDTDKGETTTTTPEEKDETPKTGVSNIGMILASLIIVLSTGAIILIRKK